MNLTPKTIFNRFLLIIVIPIIIFEIIITYIFFERHWENVTEKMGSAVINEFQLVLDAQTNFPSKAAIICDKLNMKMTVLKDTKISDLYDNSNMISNRELRQFVKQLHDKLHDEAQAFYLNNRADVRVLIQYGHDIAQFDFSRKRIQSPTTLVFLGWVLASATLLIIIAVIFMKNQIRSIIDLADMAEKLGKGQEVHNFKPSGASEIKALGKALLMMKQRLERQVSYRVEMLAHVSHDLRTPLTRLKLHVSMLKDLENVKEMNNDVVEMEILINGYLNFAKEEGNEISSQFDICEQLADIVYNYNDIRIFTKFTIPSLQVEMKKETLKRAIKNVINNALKFCKKRVKISTNKDAKSFYITIDDDGPGIAINKHKSVFKPFYKIDPNSDGYGLGLPIVKDIIYIHGGKIKLALSPLGGLRVEIKLPL